MRFAAGQSRARGSIEALPSGALGVSVYAGIDLSRADGTTSRRSSRRARIEAEAARNRLPSQVAEKRSPRTSATVDQLLERYLDQFAGSPNTLELYRTHVRNYISPCLGHVKIGHLDAETLDSFYGELRRCRRRCSSRRAIDHRIAEPHECDGRCVRHQVQALAPTTIRHIQPVLRSRTGSRRPPRRRPGLSTSRGAIRIGVRWSVRR